MGRPISSLFQIAELQKKIAAAAARLKQQQNLYEAVRGDRNVYSKNLIETQVGGGLCSFLPMGFILTVTPGPNFKIPLFSRFTFAFSSWFQAHVCQWFWCFSRCLRRDRSKQHPPSLPLAMPCKNHIRIF